MFLNRVFFLPTFLLCYLAASAQQREVPVKTTTILLRNGAVRIAPNIRPAYVDSFNANAARVHGKAFALLQFANTLSETSKKQLADAGVVLLDYVPNNAYTVSITGNVVYEVLKSSGAIALTNLSANQKLHPALLNGGVPAWAAKVPGTIDVWFSFPKTFSAAEVLALVKEKNCDVVGTDLLAYRVVAIRIAAGRVVELANYPFVEYLQPAPAPDQPLNQNSRAGSRANVLNASIADGGKGLNGEGVVVGIGDNSDVQSHADFSGRLINRAAEAPAGHGTHVTGTVAGAGNIAQMYRGYAPKATVVSQAFSGILNNAAAYVQDYGMVITNNSYGNIDECSYHGLYDLYSRVLDQQAFDLPNLEHVFAAGNSGGTTCAPYALGFRTVYGGYQSAKNVITVGATNDSGALGGFSSKGPVRDGRIKPEITAMGEFVASTWPVNIYSYNTGTSMAAPAVSGGLALLYQRYRQVNGGANPKSGLMKALLCNGAVDRGNAGPDFSYGYGWMNLLRSIDMIETAHYFNSTVTNGTTNTHTITVPANTAQLKVMLYWHDPAASLLSAQTLVNDLDLQVINPAAATTLPNILDTLPANINTPAFSGADHINNMEQVVINNPAAGNYTINVRGTAINQNPSQEYFVVYDPIPVSLRLTFPVGGEALAPSTSDLDRVKISWDAFGNSADPYTIQFSTDGGNTWADVATNLNANRRIFTWSVPNVATEQARIRIVQSNTGISSTSNLFTILNGPSVSLAATQCEGYIAINWTAVPGATDYEVMQLKGDEMQPVATTTSLNYTIAGLSKDSNYLVSVRARLNGKGGYRAYGVFRQPNSGNCSGNISDNDLKLQAITAPASGRKLTSTELSNAAISVEIKNLDDAPVTGFTVQYAVNGGAPVSENVAATIAPGAVYTHTFATPYNFSVVGNYQVVAVVKNNTTDVVTANDTLVKLIKQLDNQPLNLTTAFIDNMETATVATYPIDTIGITGLDRYDFSHSTPYGRLRTFVNSGIAFSGNKALTLDADRYYTPGNTNYLTGTFNTSNYNTTANDLRLDFEYNNHGQPSHAANKVWVRGADTQPWIVAYDLSSSQNDPGIYKKTISIELSDLLANNGQSFTPSFQIRWGQFGQIQATDKENAAGYTFDDVRIYEVFNDLQLQSIDAPTSNSCGLAAATTVAITVRNSANTAITSVPVKYRINGGSWVQETIPSIPANTAVSYTFTTPANFAAIGTYTLQALVDYSADSFRDNDTATASIINTPVITSFPYLQNFETDNGYWYATGKHSSWEYGTPASSKINGAASGAKAWKTRLAGNYNDLEASYLYSPCYDVTGMTAPTLSFSLALDLEDCGANVCDAAWVEYSADGITWTKLGNGTTGTNWYNNATDKLWSKENYTRWHVATTPLPTGLSKLRLRFVVQSDEAVNREGIAIDDIHIYDNTKGIYAGTISTPVQQTITGGTNWIDFVDGGKLIASIQPNNQSLGDTKVQAFVNTTGVRNANNQYYHDRNITIKPTTRSLTDSATIRFYFLDSETEALLNATSCGSCTKPASAYKLGVAKYADIDTSFENGTIADNTGGLWSFISAANAVKVPFDKGYYAEFKVKDFSEFWLSNAPFLYTNPLAVLITDFAVKKGANGNDVVVSWTSDSEDNVAYYEVQVARSNQDLSLNKFTSIGTVSSGQSHYTFTDAEAAKTGARYYRIKTVNKDGSFRYTEIKSVLFGDALAWQLYPNPSKAVFQLVYQVPAGAVVPVRLTDVTGRLIKEFKLIGNGFLQKEPINLSAQPGTGVYLLQATYNGKTNTYKLFKQ